MQFTSNVRMPAGLLSSNQGSSATDQLQWCCSARPSDLRLRAAGCSVSLKAKKSQPGVMIGMPAPLASISLASMTGSSKVVKASASAQVSGSPIVELVDVSGRWIKDRELSDPMGAAMDAMSLGGVVRQAVKLLRGIDVKLEEAGGRGSGTGPGSWRMDVFSVLTWFKVTERYPLDGTSVKCRRRDLRRGGHEGHIVPGHLGPHGGLLLALSWGDPHAGNGTDEFVLVPAGSAAAEKAAAVTKGMPQFYGANAPVESQARHTPGGDELHVYSELRLRDPPSSGGPPVVRYRTVYHRKGGAHE